MRNLLFLCCLAALVYACGGPKTKTSSQGHEYTLHVDAGNPKAQPGDFIYFHAYMRNGDSVVYSSRQQGQTPVIQVPPADAPDRQLGPVEDVLRELGVGDSVTIGIRIDTLDQRPPGFENTDVLYYDVVVTELVDEAEFNAQREQAQAEMQQRMEAAITRAPEAKAFAENVRSRYYAGTIPADSIQTTDSGLKYIIHEPGNGAEAEPGQVVEVQYIGMLPDGTVFDQSFERGRAIAFRLGMGDVIPGWDEGIDQLREGARATLIIPASLGYGEQGSPPVIPPNSELVFYVEVEKAGEQVQ